MRHRTFVASIVAAGVIGAGIAAVTTGDSLGVSATNTRGTPIDQQDTKTLEETDDWRSNAVFAEGVLFDAYVPITPCRLVDSRPTSAINPSTFTLAPGQTQRVNIHFGECVIPETATALVANITAVGQTDQTFLTVYPTGADRPLAATLNPTPGLPAYNAVTVPLGADTFNVFNNRGFTDYIIDVSGYYDATFVPTPPTAGEAVAVEIFDYVFDGIGTIVRLSALNITETYTYDVVFVWIECPDGDVFGDSVFMLDPGEAVQFGIYCSGEITGGARVASVEVSI